MDTFPYRHLSNMDSLLSTNKIFIISSQKPLCNPNLLPSLDEIHSNLNLFIAETPGTIVSIICSMNHFLLAVTQTLTVLYHSVIPIPEHVKMLAFKTYIILQFSSSRKFSYLPHGKDFFQDPPPHPSGNSNYLSFTHFFKFLVLQNPPPHRKFQSVLWGEYGYFLDLHIKTIMLCSKFICKACN